MAKRTTTFGLSSKKLVNLMRIAEESGSPRDEIDQEQAKTELLCDYLAQTLAVYRHEGEDLLANQSQLRNTMDILPSAPVGKLLQESQTDINLIRMAKDFSSRLSKRAKSKAEHHVANTIYYAAIAHALVFHDRRITRYTYESLSKSFSKLAKEKWIHTFLVELFVRASEHCQVKMAPKNGGTRNG